MASVTSSFVQKFSFLSSKKSCQENEVSYQSNKSENIMTEIHKILIWDNPFVSCCCILFVNIVFWLIVYLDLKFYGIIFITLLILTCEQLWMEHFSKAVNSKKSDSEDSVSDSSKTLYQRMFGSTETNTLLRKFLNLLSDTYVKAKFLRETQPGMFCVLTCLCFLVIGVIGKSFSGLTSFYLLLMAVMTLPGALVRFLPPEVIKAITDLFHGRRPDGVTDSDEEVEPYLMDTNEEALEVLRKAGDLQLPDREDDEDSNDLLLERISERTNDTTESVCSKFSLYPESAVMPSPENSMDFWETDGNFWDKSTENPHDINFQSQHFDGDSSEEEFVKGLDLSGKSVKKNKNSNAEQTNPVSAENLIGKNLLASQSKPKSSTGSDRESSSDTDSFELISEGDISLYESKLFMSLKTVSTPSTSMQIQ